MYMRKHVTGNSVRIRFSGVNVLQRQQLSAFSTPNDFSRVNVLTLQQLSPKRVFAPTGANVLILQVITGICERVVKDKIILKSSLKKFPELTKVSKIQRKILPGKKLPVPKLGRFLSGRNRLASGE